MCVCVWEREKGENGGEVYQSRRGWDVSGNAIQLFVLVWLDLKHGSGSPKGLDSLLFSPLRVGLFAWLSLWVLLWRSQTHDRASNQTRTDQTLGMDRSRWTRAATP